MRHFRVTVQIGNRAGERFERIEALVDTGATYTWIPRDVLKQPTIAVFGEPESEPILGVFALEGFRLAPDPLNRRLISVPALLKTA